MNDRGAQRFQNHTKDKAVSFYLTTLKSNYEGHATLFVGNGPRVFKGLIATRMVYKKDIWKKSQLGPRQSDVDYFISMMKNVGEDDFSDGAAGVGGVDGSDAVTATEDTQEIVAAFEAFLEQNKPSDMIRLHMTPPLEVPQIFGSIMMAAVSCDTMQGVAEMLAEACAAKVMVVMPRSLNEVAIALDACREQDFWDKLDLEEKPQKQVTSLKEMEIGLKLVFALRAQLFLYFMDCIGRMPTPRVDPNATMGEKSKPLPFLSPEFLLAVKERLEFFDVSSKGAAAFSGEPVFLEPLLPDGIARSEAFGKAPVHAERLDFAGACRAWAGVVYEVTEFIKAHDGRTYSIDRVRFRNELVGKKAETLKTIMLTHGLSISKEITASIELFPGERNQVNAALSQAYDEKHSDRKKAWCYAVQGVNQAVMSRLLEKHAPAPAPQPGKEAAVKDAKSDASGGSDPDKQIGAGLTPLHHWVQQAIDAETVTGTEPLCQLKAVVSKVQHAVNELLLAELASYKGSGGHGNGLAIKTLAEVDTGDNKAKLEVQRYRMANEVERKDVKVYFLGTVVEESVGSTMPRASCLSLGNNGGKGPTLYISGAKNNLRRSTGSVAWAIPALKRKAEAEETNTGVKKSPEKKAKVEPVETHVMDWQDLKVEVAGSEFCYQLPFLRDNRDGGHADVYGQKCFRNTIGWDTTKPSEKKSNKEETPEKNFLMS